MLTSQVNLLRSIIKYGDNKNEKVYWDISPIFANYWNCLLDQLGNKSKCLIDNIDIIMGIEAKGLLIASSLAFRLNVPFLALRKQGKLPGDVHSFETSRQQVYQFQQHYIESKQNILIIDDILHDENLLSNMMDYVCSIKKVKILSLVFLNTLESISDHRINYLYTTIM